jgi:hypothetical protein
MDIQADSEDIEKLRERLRNMTDPELRQYGRSATLMSDSPKSFGQPTLAFAVQLEEARAEWRKRHPSSPSRAGRGSRLPSI